MRVLSMDLRQRIVAACDDGQGTQPQVAKRFAVSLGMVKKLLAQRRRTGDIAPRYHRCGGKPKILKTHQRQLRALVRKTPDLTLEQLRAATGLRCSLHRHPSRPGQAGPDVQKKTLRASEQDRPDVARRRRAWRRRQRAGRFDPARLVFLDEAGAKTNRTRLRGRAPRGERLHAKAPHGHWKTTTMISSVRLDGTTACMTIAGATDTLVLREYVKQVLCPSLRPGDVVVMDNLVPHKSVETLALIEAAGASGRFLPAYSPDLNPIEKMWSKVKNSLRSAEARTLPDLELAVATALQSVTAQDAQGWFQSCGYNSN